MEEQQPRAWQEATERDVVVEARRLDRLVNATVSQLLELPPSEATETLCGAEDRITGLIVRTQEPILGRITLSASRLDEELYKITPDVANEGASLNQAKPTAITP